MGTQFSVKLAEVLIRYLTETNPNAYTDSSAQDLASKASQTLTVAWSALGKLTGYGGEGASKFHGKEGMDACLKIGLHFKVIDSRDLQSIKDDVLASTGPLRKTALLQAFVVPETRHMMQDPDRDGSYELFRPGTENFNKLDTMSYGDCDKILSFLCLDLETLKSTSGKAVIKLLSTIFNIKQKDLDAYIERCKEKALDVEDVAVVTNQQLAAHLSAFKHRDKPLLSFIFEKVMQTKEQLQPTRSDFASGRIWQTVSPSQHSSIGSGSGSRRPSFGSSNG